MASGHFRVRAEDSWLTARINIAAQDMQEGHWVMAAEREGLTCPIRSLPFVPSGRPTSRRP